MATVSGYVEKIKYRNEENGYSILSVNSDGLDYVLVGTFPYISEGDFIEASGRDVEHPIYGDQIQVESYELKAPEDTASMERYLGSGAIRGVGTALAARIVRRFKADTFRIIEEEPERLAEVKGISERKAREIAVQVEEKKDMRQAMIYLQKYGIATTLAAKIYQYYGQKIYRVLEENPYQMADHVPGVGFKTADEIASKVGIHTDSDYRIRSGIFYTLIQSVSEGHVYLLQEVLLYRASQLLDVEVQHIEKYVMDLAMEKKVVLKESDEGLRVYSAHYYYMELTVAKMLHDLNVDFDVTPSVLEHRIHMIEEQAELALDDRQREAVMEAVRHGILIVTGGPGTGKTTTINAMIHFFEEEGADILLAAPTGRAAKRMSELTGMEAQTVHRLLGMTWNEAAHQVTFQKTEKEPLEAEAVIVDEMSMVDVSLFSALLRALRPGTRLVLVGDADQLPSVGAGNVFSDLIRSKKIETVFLREVFRQAEQSAIIRNAHRVNLGESPDLKGNQGDFFFLCRRDAQRAVATVLELCKTRLPDNMHIPAEQIQVLTPTRKGPCGTINLNRLLQEALNPRTPGKREILWGERVFRVGDRIMQTRNDYDVVWQKDDGTVGTGMFNGDVGRIAEIDAGGEWLALDFVGRKAPYSVEMLSEIDLAYAQTVHKAQGSEYRCVVLAAMPSAPSLMVRGVLYTALTRARELLVIVGDDAAVRSMAANDKQQKRYSGLKWRLCHAGDASE